MQKLGPLLQFLGCRGSDWGISALVVTDDADAPPVISFAAAALPATRVSTAVPGQPCTAWRFDFAVPQTARGITGTMLEFPTTSHRMIGCRNFLTLQPDAPVDTEGLKRYWVNWWAESEPHPYTKVIHPVG